MKHIALIWLFIITSISCQSAKDEGFFEGFLVGFLTGAAVVVAIYEVGANDDANVDSKGANDDANVDSKGVANDDNGVIVHEDFREAHTFVKFENANFSIWITKAFLVNKPKALMDISGTVRQCNDGSSHLLDNVIFTIDLDDVDCVDKIYELEQDEDLNNYTAIIFLENWDNRSSNSYRDMVGKIPQLPTQTITNIKSQTKIPIISIPKNDTEYFKNGLEAGKSDDNPFEISFKSLDSLLEVNDHTSSPLFQVSCTFDKGEGCLHFFSNPPKHGENFLGCAGEPKRRVNMDIRCKSNNRECPELQSWKQTLPSKDYETCAVKEGSLGNNVYPPLTCKRKSRDTWDLGPVNDLSGVSCMDEENWVARGGNNKICNKEHNFQINHPNCRKHKQVTCKKWGRWSTFSRCTDVQLGYTKERYRFCVDIKSEIKSNAKCIILENEIWAGRSNCNTKYACRPRNYGI